MICSPTLYSVCFSTKCPCKLTLFSVIGCVEFVLLEFSILVTDSVVELGWFVVVTGVYVILYLFVPTSCNLVAVNPG